MNEIDIKWMKKAIQLAESGRGFVSPNPLVGCVIVNKDGKLIGKGFHEKFGQAHAEVNAVKSVKDKLELEDATVYVTLEPCSHHGKTPPCADLLAKLPVKRVVIAQKDPNPLVSGKGISKLEQAGKEVEVGVLQNETQVQNEFFLHFITHKKPFVLLKIAQTIDGYSAAVDGSSQWITGKAARTLVHQWRAQYDAVLIGRNTALIDNPSLTVRHVKGRQPFRVVLDGSGNLPQHLKLFNDQFEEKTIHVIGNRPTSDVLDSLFKAVSGETERKKTLVVGLKNNHIDLKETLFQLGSMGIASVMVEAGSELASAFIREKLVQKVACFIAPKWLGNGKKAISELGIHSIQQALEFKQTTFEQIGEDFLLTGYF